MIRPIRSFLGYYKVYLPEKSCPQILNMCRDKKIMFFSPLPKEDAMEVKVTLFSLKSFLEVCEQSGVTPLEILPMGLPFILNRYKNRYGIYLGLILSLGFFLYSSMLIWEIKITGNVNISESEIKSVIQRHGIYEGAFIPDIDADVTAEYILLDYTPLSSIAINVKGTVATVDVIERVSKEDPEFKEYPAANLIAAQGGIITNVSAREGAPCVKAGDVVKEGQLLVNGVVENRFHSFKLVNAKGYVYADVVENLTFEVPFESEISAPTGNIQTKAQLSFLNRVLDFYGEVYCDYPVFKAQTVTERINILGFKTPFTVSKTVYSEYVKQPVVLDKEQAKQKAERDFGVWLAELSGGEVVSYRTAYQITDDSYILNARVVVNKNIAVQEEIKFIPRYTHP